jgi:hypothetical protein
MQESRCSRVELVPRSETCWPDADADIFPLPSDFPPTKATARLYWLHHPSRPDVVKIVNPDETVVTYDSYDYAAEQLAVADVIAWPDVSDQAERDLAKVGRGLF